MSETAPEKLTGQRIGRGLTAGFLAWLLPGAGHLYLGARGRALSFFAIVMATLTLGLLLDGNLAMADRVRAPFLTRLQVVANLSLGPMEPVIRRSLYGALVYVTEDGQPPRHATRAQALAIEERSARFERPRNSYGSAYLLIACLMNMLLIMDAWDIGIGRKR
jgi:hypothetical protein